MVEVHPDGTAATLPAAMTREEAEDFADHHAELLLRDAGISCTVFATKLPQGGRYPDFLGVDDEFGFLQIGVILKGSPEQAPYRLFRAAEHLTAWDPDDFLSAAYPDEHERLLEALHGSIRNLRRPPALICCCLDLPVSLIEFTNYLSRLNVVCRIVRFTVAREPQSGVFRATAFSVSPTERAPATGAAGSQPPCPNAEKDPADRGPRDIKVTGLAVKDGWRWHRLVPTDRNSERLTSEEIHSASVIVSANRVPGRKMVRVSLTVVRDGNPTNFGALKATWILRSEPGRENGGYRIQLYPDSTEFASTVR